MQILRTVFPGRLISHFGQIIWPTRSLDHAVPDCFLQGYVKSKVYKTCPANTADLKQRILQCMQVIPKEMLQHVMTAFPSRLQECTECCGCYIQVSYSNNDDWDEFSWTRNAPDSVNIIFPLCLKKLFNLKNRLLFWHILYYVKIYTSFCTHGHNHLSPEPVHSHP